jgi:hypothetical protein
MSWPIISDESVAGPSVAMILVLLMGETCPAKLRETGPMKRGLFAPRKKGSLEMGLDL